MWQILTDPHRVIGKKKNNKQHWGKSALPILLFTCYSLQISPFVGKKASQNFMRKKDDKVGNKNGNKKGKEREKKGKKEESEKKLK